MTMQAYGWAGSTGDTSALFDLTTTSLRELREISTPEFAAAIRRTIDEATVGNLTAIQEQRQ